MAKSRKRKHRIRTRRVAGAAHSPPTQQKPSFQYILEQASVNDMRAAKARNQRELRYQWDFYSELARQRSEIQEDLKKVLIESCISSFPFEKWQRAVKWKYGLHPLSTAGSLKFIGNRFNTGEDVNSAVPSFPGLYIACNKDTALQETLGQPDQPGAHGLTARELALMNPQSETFVSVSGELEKVFDLRNPENLKGFLDLIKSFKLSDQLKQLAAELGFVQPAAVKTTKQLHLSLMDRGWRINPSRFDVPSNPQIFGSLIFQSGIEGILYPSTLNGADCLCIFPHTFAVSSSFIAFDDDTPHPRVPKKIDSANWRVCDLSAEEILNDLH